MERRFGLFCKSFRDDLRRFERLYASVEAHVEARLPFLVSVPRADLALFEGRFGKGRIDFVTDEALVGRDIVQSWRMQQVVKLCAWKADFADAFLMLDSDFYFIRPFGASDFLHPDGRLRFVLSRTFHKYEAGNAPLRALLRDGVSLDPVTSEECRSFPRGDTRFGDLAPWRPWLDAITRPTYDERKKRIRRVFRRSGPDLQVMPGPIWSRAAHAAFHRDFLEPRRLDAFDLIRHAPWEYLWHAEWRLASGLEDAAPSEPLFLHFASDDAIEHARAAGLRLSDFARHYAGLSLAARHQEIEEY